MQNRCNFNGTYFFMVCLFVFFWQMAAIFYVGHFLFSWFPVVGYTFLMHFRRKNERERFLFLALSLLYIFLPLTISFSLLLFLSFINSKIWLIFLKILNSTLFFDFKQIVLFFKGWRKKFRHLNQFKLFIVWTMLSHKVNKPWVNIFHMFNMGDLTLRGLCQGLP